MRALRPDIMQLLFVVAPCLSGPGSVRRSYLAQDVRLAIGRFGQIGTRGGVLPPALERQGRAGQSERDGS